MLNLRIGDVVVFIETRGSVVVKKGEIKV